MMEGTKPKAQIVKIDTARARKQSIAAMAAQQSATSLEQIENVALLLLAAEVAMLCDTHKSDMLLRQIAQSTHAVLRRVTGIIAQAAGNLGAPIPELLDNRLECLSEQDAEYGCFERVIDQYYGGDVDHALDILKRLRQVDSDLGLPHTDSPEQWSEGERLQAISWLRCVEHVQEVAVTLDWPTTQTRPA